MSGTIQFNRTYCEYGPQVRDFEKTPDVIAVIDHFIGLWGYSVGDLMGTRFTAQWLGDGEKSGKAEDELDLMIEMNATGFFEIVLRNGNGDSQYGGWLYGKQPVVVSDDIVNGYRVILTTGDDGSQLRHEFIPSIGYEPVAGAKALPLRSQKRKAMRRAG
jgi:hypothetical protein